MENYALNVIKELNKGILLIRWME